MRFATILLFFIIFAFSAFGQQPGPRYAPDEGKERARIEGVIRVFMHKPDDYSVMTRENGKFPVYRIDKWLGWLNAEKNFMTWSKWDFEQQLAESKDGKMRVVVKEYPAKQIVVTTITVISEKVVDGAGWTEHSGPHGRYRREQMTTVIR